MYVHCFLRFTLLLLVFLAFFLSLSLGIRQRELSSESDELYKDESEELEDEDEELEEDGSESGFGFGTVLRRGRTSS